MGNGSMYQINVRIKDENQSISENTCGQDLALPFIYKDYPMQENPKKQNAPNNINNFDNENLKFKK